MRILNTRRQTADKPLTEADVRKVALQVNVPLAMLVSEMMFTATLDLSREEDKRFLAWLDACAANAG
jgi:hypothetical protein